jgi:hypothetical protein
LKWPENYKTKESIQHPIFQGEQGKMSDQENDYSEFMAWMSNSTNMHIFLCGFTFTILTLLVINLPYHGCAIDLAVPHGHVRFTALPDSFD